MSSGRKQTPPAVKWVANQVAALKGELERIDLQMEALTARRTRVARELAALGEVGGVMGLPELQAVMPAVRVHKAYGGRGFLTDWVRGVLQAAAPKAVDMRTLTLLAAEQFQLTFSTPDERDDYRKNTLGRAVRKLLQLGLVERLHDPVVPTGPGVWRWKEQLPSFEAIRQAMEREEARWHLR